MCKNLKGGMLLWKEMKLWFLQYNVFFRLGDWSYDLDIFRNENLLL